MDNFQFALVVSGVVVTSLILIGAVFSRLYKRASKENAFVRTGLGGEKVIMDGGALVFPVLHESVPVNMNTLRLEVSRKNEQALITFDRMRVDVQAEFYLRVKPTKEAIANAAQTLGGRTLEPEKLKELIEGKFVDSLRAVAAEMAMIDLHEKRVDFVQKVQTAVSEDLLKNGLELESVSLTGFDQTTKDYFNPDNIFDAEGLTRLTEAVEARKKRRNEIELETDVAIKKKDLEAEQQKLNISREQEYARLQQNKEISIKRALQETEIAKEVAENQRQSEEAKIEAERQTEKARISSEQEIEQLQIEKIQAVKAREINKDQNLKQAEMQNQRIIETTRIENQKSVDLADQNRKIAYAEKSKEQSEAKAIADLAEAEAAKAEECIISARQREIAERERQIEITEANKEAEKQAISIKVAAEAEKQAAEDKAVAIRTLAEAYAEELKIQADADAESIKLRTVAKDKEFAVEAEGARLLNEAANILCQEQIQLKMKLALIEALPKIIAESTKPLEKIDGIKILQMGNQGFAPGEAAGDKANSSLSDQIVNSALRYRSQAPLVDTLLQELGLNGQDLAGLTKGVATDIKADLSNGSDKFNDENLQ